VALITLRGAAEFKRVFAKGQARRSNGLVLHWAANSMEHNRYGLVAKSTLGTAVARNRVRRWMRELLRSWAPAIEPGYDIVLVARDRDVTAAFAQFSLHLATVLHKAELMEGQGAG